MLMEPSKLDISTYVAIGLFAAWCFQWIIHVVAIIYGWMKLHRPASPSAAASLQEESLPGVSVLKPLTGVDPHLFANLETFFNLKYPTFELLFCVEDDSDSAIMIVNSLMEKYPKVNAQLFIGARKVGVNPKINNMVQGYEAAKYNHVLISDSGLKMKEDTLMVMMSCFGETTGLVHQMPFVCDREGFSGALEKVYFGTQHAKMYLSADLLGINCVTGMSCLFRKDILEDAGGFAYLGKFLAEDYYLGKVFIERGWAVKVCPQPALQNAGNSSVSNFQARMMRWIKLRSTLVPSTIVLEPVSESVLLGIMISWSVNILFSWTPIVFFFIHILAWFLLDYLLLRIVQGGSIPFSKFDFVACWLFRESTSLYTMLKAHCQRQLTWRNRKYILKWGGVGEDVKTRVYANSSYV